MQQNLLFLQRYARPTNVSYENGIWKLKEKEYGTDNVTVKDVPIEKALASMLDGGYVTLRKNPIPFEERSYYGSGDHQIRNQQGSVLGNYTFNIVMAFPEETRKRFRGIRLTDSIKETGHSFDLADFKIPTHYAWEAEEFILPSTNSYQIKTLLDNVALFGGETKGREPLKEIYYGSKISEIMDELRREEGSEGKPPGFTK